MSAAGNAVALAAKVPTRMAEILPKAADLAVAAKVVAVPVKVAAMAATTINCGRLVVVSAAKIVDCNVAAKVVDSATAAEVLAAPVIFVFIVAAATEVWHRR